jgi:hypothetical protein
LDLNKIVIGARLSGVEMGGKYYQMQTSFRSSLYPLRFDI